MTFFKTLSNSLIGTVRKTEAYDIEVMRQNTPPDERDLEASEQLPAAMGQTRKSNLRGILSRLNILAPVIVGLLEILPSVECDILLSSF